MLFRHCVSETVAEIQRRPVHASSPTLIGQADLPRHGRRDGHDLDIKSVQEVRHLRAEAAVAIVERRVS